MFGKLRALMLAATLGVMLSNSAQAGVVCEAIGKGWDKAVGKMVKAHEAAQAHLKEGCQAIKGAGGKLKSGKHGGNCNCR